MVEVIVFAEGPTEEKFIKLVVAPNLKQLKVFLKPETLRTSTDAKGGAVNFDRLKFYARNTLRGKRDVVLSTFLDLYGLTTDFPKFEEAKQKSSVYARASCLEDGLHEALIDQIGCQPDRFLPHIQPYEFEGLLFSDVEALIGVEPTWIKSLSGLDEVRKAFDTPEHINDSYETKPSKRLENMLQPKYHKTRHGPLAAERITLAVMERECPHFRGWIDKLRGLAAS